MISPRRARYSQAASASDAHAHSAGAGASRPVGRLELPSFFSHLTDARTAQLAPRLLGEDRGQCLTTPRGMAGTMLQRVVGDEAIEVGRQGAGHGGGATGTGAILEPLAPRGGKALDPCAQGGRGKVEGVRDGLEALAFDDRTPGLGTTEDTCFRALSEQGL